MTSHQRRAAILLAWVLLLSACSGPRPVDVPDPKKVILDNGMTAFILEDESLPTFRLTLISPSGSSMEALGQAGLAEITAQSLRTGGTEKQSAQEIEEIIADRSATLEFGTDRESASIELGVLAEDRRPLLEVLADLLRAPGFDAQAVGLAKRQALVSLRQSKESPSGLAGLFFPQLIYGESSIWSQFPSEAGLQAITDGDVRAFYQRFYHPEKMFLAVTGHFKAREIVTELNETLGQWRGSGRSDTSWPPAAPFEAKSVFVPKDAAQVDIRLGHQGLERTHPDKFAVLVANFILGGSGSMTSRLGQHIRSGQGQAYSVYSYYGFKRVPGIFAMIAQTESSQVLAVVQGMKSVVEELQQSGPREDEVADAKTAILRSLLFDYEVRHGIGQDWAKFAFWGYPEDYLDEFVAGIRAVDVKDVRRVLEEHFRPENMSLLIVGPNSLWSSLQQEWPEIRKGFESEASFAVNPAERHP